MKYLGIGLTSATFAFFLSLSTGLLDAGIRAHGDDQAVITALGGTTFGITILVGIIAMIVVAVLSLKRRGDGASPIRGSLRSMLCWPASWAAASARH